MDKYTIKRTIDQKVQEFNRLFQMVKLFKNHMVKAVDFPEYGICRNDVQMNRLLKTRRDEIVSLSNQLV